MYFYLSRRINFSVSKSISISVLQSIDIGALCVHPACVVSVTLTQLRTETSRLTSKDAESIILNISGRLLMVQRELKHSPDSDNSSVSVMQTLVK